MSCYKDKGDITFDTNQQYTYTLTTCDSYGWAMYMPTDEVNIYDGRMDTGRYYVETTNLFVLEGNYWYCDSVADKALGYKLITSGNIKYQLKATLSLKPSHFNKSVL